MMVSMEGGGAQDRSSKAAGASIGREAPMLSAPTQQGQGLGETLE